MKILMTIDSLRSDEGGPPRSVPELAKAITQLGVRLELWTLAGQERIEGLDIRRFASCMALARKLKSTNPRRLLVHDNGLWRPFNWIVCRTARSLRIPYVISTRGMLEPWSLRQSPWKKRIAWRVYQHRLLNSAAGLHATGTLEAANLRSIGLRTPIIVQPNGVTVPPGTRPPTSPSTALYLSRIHAKKGVELLLHAWAAIRPAGWRLCIAGPAEPRYLTALKTLCVQQNIADSVQWRGELNDNDKWELMASAELLVLPSFSENFGTVVAEALAAGVPVITTTATPWSELEAQHCGYCVPPEAEALTVALKKLIGMPQASRRRMGQNGRSWVTRAFSWSEIARNMVDCYGSIINDQAIADHRILRSMN